MIAKKNLITEEKKTRCPFCESGKLREVSNIIGVEYPTDREFTIYKCLSCSRIFDEREIEHK
jgi:uncharacterized protein with PIN domain